ncbi:MAG: hypothetical protein CL824_00735 [Crocinitomicaceae bacterium]|nr:hypothetical protein [Crocinitomicaceae bacterium]
MFSLNRPIIFSLFGCKNSFLLFLSFLFSNMFFFSQCNLIVEASNNNIGCGDCVTLSAEGQVLNPVFEEDFNSGQPVGWDFSQIVIISNNTCVPSPDGTNYMWMGTNSAAPRSMETMAYDLSIGGQICFEMRYSDNTEQPGGNPFGAPNPHCEDPDAIDEGVFLQYSIDNGLTWVTIDYWAPLLGGGPGPQTIWDNYCVAIPIAAQTPNTKIRWFQNLSSGAIYDNWGLDNIKISANIPVTNYEITWLHDNFSHGLGNYNVINPNQVCPENDSTFNAIMTNGIDTCFASVNILINTISIDNISVNHPNCGAVEGDIDISVTGGTGNYSYSIDNGINFQTNSFFTPVDTAVYTVVVLDQNNCTDTANVSVVGVDSLSLDDVSLIHPCDNNILGEISIAVSGGTPSYQYSIDGGATYFPTNTFSSLPSGIYSVFVKDDANCIIDTTITLILPSPLTINYSIQEILCFDDATGSIDLNVSGGFSPYSYDWGISSSEDLFNLITGNYSVVVTDDNGCLSNENFVLNQPTPLQLNAVAQNVVCYDGIDGSIDLQVSGGVFPYTYIWSNGLTTQDISSLPVDLYEVIVTDDNGCVDSVELNVNQPINPLTLSETHFDVFCFGDASGSIDLNIVGGTFPYNVNWDNGQATEDIIGLTTGNYSVVVIDDNNCEEHLVVNISEPLSPLSLSETHIDALCVATETGSIDLTISGGTPNYSFIWSNGETTEDIDDLMAGSYDVDVIDDNGCSISSTINIVDPSTSISATANVNHVSCHGLMDGVIDLTVTGGNPGYSYDWNNSSTLQDISNLSEGNYYVTITDDIGCQFFISVDIVQPLAPLSIDTIITDVVCFNSNTGAIDLIVSGGSLPYSYDWNSGVYLTEDVNNINAGTYSVQVTDDNGCFISADVDVDHLNPEIIITLDSHKDVSCHQGDDAYINVNVVGGVPSYNFSWNNNAWNTQNISNLSHGQYSLVVTDIIGCSASFIMDIDEPVAPLSLNPLVNHVNCFGGDDGSISLNVSGGTTPYTYNWNSLPPIGNPTDLNAGNYSVDVVDFNGCVDSFTVDITEPNSPLIVTAETSSPLCYGTASGSIDITVNGGTAPYSYLWNVSQNQNDQDLIDIHSGTYDLNVTDDNNCVFFLSVDLLDEFDPIEVISTITPITCFGFDDGSIELDISGGNAPYQLMWNDANNDQNRYSLNAGLYSVSITDDNGCELLSDFILDQPEELNASFAYDVSSGCAPLTVNFSNTSQGISNLCLWSFGNGDTINGCSDLSYTFDQPGCYDISLLTMVNSECYDDIVLDEVICVYPNPTASFQSATPTVDYYSGELSLLNNSINATSFEWIFGDDSPNSNEVNPIHFYPSETISDYEITLIAYDDNGCVDTSVLIISLQPDLLVHIPNTFTVNGDNINEGFMPVFSNPEMIKKYQIEIFNRWGEIIFQTNDALMPWDGTHGRKNRISQEGVYTWRIKYTGLDNIDETLVGHVSLLK